MIEKLILGAFVLALAALVLAAKKGKLFGVVLALAIPVFSQANCDKVVADTANMIGGNKIDLVAQAAGPLINQGADVHIVTVPDSHGNLDLVENEIEKSCPSWRNGQGVRKSTLLALMVSKDRKLGIYYGSAWHNALDNHWNRIKTDYMVPRFRDGDYGGGFIAAEEQLTKRLIAAKDESLKPAVSQTINQPTDFSGLWKFMTWLLVIGLIGGCGWIIIYTSNKKKRESAARLSSQQNAQAARNLAAQDIGALEKDFETKEAIGTKIPQYAKDILDRASQQYTNLANSEAYNPDSSDFTAAQYTVIQQQYEKVSKMVTQAKAAQYGVAKAENQDKQPSTQSAPSTASEYSTESKHSKHSSTSATSEAKYTPPTSVPTQNYQPVYPVYPVYTEPSVVVINEGHESHRHNDDWPVTRSEGWGSSSSSSSSSDSDSGGGGSSSWSSSDSGSSFDSDSGSSSSFDSGSSDSGGGGSSDF